MEVIVGRRRRSRIRSASAVGPALDIGDRAANPRCVWPIAWPVTALQHGHAPSFATRRSAARDTGLIECSAQVTARRTRSLGTRKSESTKCPTRRGIFCRLDAYWRGVRTEVSPAAIAPRRRAVQATLDNASSRDGWRLRIDQASERHAPRSRPHRPCRARSRRRGRLLSPAGLHCRGAQSPSVGHAQSPRPVARIFHGAAHSRRAGEARRAKASRRCSAPSIGSFSTGTRASRS